MSYKEPTFHEILVSIREGVTKGREYAKKDAHQHSGELKDAAWKAGEEIINSLAEAFLNVPPEKKYPPFTVPHHRLMQLLTEYAKTFQNAFRLAEEGYYRSAFAELRDLLEIVMMLKLFYLIFQKKNKSLYFPQPCQAVFVK